MRLAIVSTPRSGNTWLRYILAKRYSLEQYAIHRPNDLDWGILPENCVVQIHWHKSMELSTILESHGFRVLTIARHPFDVLISILHFSMFEPQTAYWLDGEGGGESSIFNKSPTCPEFYLYATGPRAKALLSVTPEWWNAENVLRIRYEDLVFQPSETIKTLFQSLRTPEVAFSEILESFSLDKLRTSAPNQHFWKGCPGLWKSLLPPKIAYAFAEVHSEVLSTLDYKCDPKVDLVNTIAEAAW